MKAVCVLVCVALAQGISANIFKRSHQPASDNLIVQPLEFIQRPLYQPFKQTYQQYIRTQKNGKQNKYEHSSESASTSHERVREVFPETTEYIGDESSVGRAQPARKTHDKWNAPIYTQPMKELDQQKKLSADDTIAWRTLEMPVDALFTGGNSQDTIQEIYSKAQKVMQKSTPEQKVKFQESYAAAVRSQNEDKDLNATQLLKKNNYPVEEHTIKTEDGYYLTLFRIPAQQQQIRDVSKKPVVFLMHGLLGSADDWLLMGPGKSLAYLLSDAGYDVWLGNARGNKYSRRHVSKHPALSDFWQFSNDEVALVDLPSMIDYVLEITEQQKLHYVGHSSGTTDFFALASSSQEYSEKIISMHALAPMVYMNDVRSPLIRMIAPTSQFEENLHHQIGHASFNPKKELIASAGGEICENQIGNKQVCSNVYFVMTGVNIENLDSEVTPVIMGHLPAGASTRMIKQYGQAVSSDGFRKYDFGPVINKKVYGSVDPPKYVMEQVQVPVSLYHSQADWLAQPADVARLQRELPRVTAHPVADPHFTHMDFQFSPRAPELVYKQLIESMTMANTQY